MSMRSIVQTTKFLEDHCITVPARAQEGVRLQIQHFVYHHHDISLIWQSSVTNLAGTQVRLVL